MNVRGLPQQQRGSVASRSPGCARMLAGQEFATCSEDDFRAYIIGWTFVWSGIIPYTFIASKVRTVGTPLAGICRSRLRWWSERPTSAGHTPPSERPRTGRDHYSVYHAPFFANTNVFVQFATISTAVPVHSLSVYLYLLDVKQLEHLLSTRLQYWALRRLHGVRGYHKPQSFIGFAFVNPVVYCRVNRRTFLEK